MVNGGDLHVAKGLLGQVFRVEFFCAPVMLVAQTAACVHSSISEGDLVIGLESLAGDTEPHRRAFPAHVVADCAEEDKIKLGNLFFIPIEVVHG